jgi:hypothetical protein
MLIKYSDWKRPIDGDYAFALRPITPQRFELGKRSDIREIAREVLSAEDAERFEKKVQRWSGPEDLIGADRPYVGAQLYFEETPLRLRFTLRDVEAALTGVVQVSRSASGQTDYLLRDHHMIDVALYHYRTTGLLPGGLLHADRHSDWCKDSYLEQRRPAQAATWWKLFEGLKRPGTGESVLREDAVSFITGRAPPRKFRDIPGSVFVPSSMESRDFGWEQTLQRPEALAADWVSLDLDFFQPSPQLRLASGLVRDPRFQRAVKQAAVRVFVLSPQFTAGGDKVDPWVVQGGLHSSLRVLNLLRNQAA